MRLLFTSTMLMLFAACSKGGGNNPSPSTPTTSPRVPTVSTASATTSATGASTGGTISSDGGATITVRGVCWSTSQNPTIADSKTSDGTGSGTYTSAITGLTPFTTYFLRAYATNSAGTGYGQQVTITTSQDVPTVTTAAVTLVNIVEFRGGGQIIADGKATVTEAGVCWDTVANPTVAKNKIVSPGSGTVGSSINVVFPYSQLSAKTTYHVRAYATNAVGTGYGADMTFTPAPALGLHYGGGIIFYLDNTGQHGLVAAPTDQGTAVPWAVNTYGQTGAISTSDGATNTTKIISYVGTTGTYAAKLCRDFRGGGFTDWYLPSANELLQLRIQKNTVGGFPNPTGAISLYYWSSTEANSSQTNAGVYAHNFLGNDLSNTLSNQSKAATLSVRAIRVF